jgi:hypothetical protein
MSQDIFGRIDIMYRRLPYVSKGVLPLTTLVLYIYRSAERHNEKSNNHSTNSILSTSYPRGLRSYDLTHLSLPHRASLGGSIDDLY